VPVRGGYWWPPLGTIIPVSIIRGSVRRFGATAWKQSLCMRMTSPGSPPRVRPLAGAKQRVQRRGQRSAGDGAEGTGVGDGLESGRLPGRPRRRFTALDRELAGEEFPEPAAHHLGGAPPV
jgi:hypothetical protein